MEPLPTPPIVHPSQRKLLGYLDHQPGRSIQEIADHLGVTRTAAVYHVRRLARKGHVVALEQGNRRLLFPTRVANPLHRTLLGVLRLHTARCIAEEIHREPTIGWRALARRLHLSARTVRWHVRRLENHGLVRVSSSHGRKHYASLHPDFTAALHLNGLPATTPYAEHESRLPTPL